MSHQKCRGIAEILWNRQVVCCCLKIIHQSVAVQGFETCWHPFHPKKKRKTHDITSKQYDEHRAVSTGPGHAEGRFSTMAIAHWSVLRILLRKQDLLRMIMNKGDGPWKMETLNQWFNGSQWEIFETIGLLGAVCSDKPMQQFGKEKSVLRNLKADYGMNQN